MTLNELESVFSIVESEDKSLDSFVERVTNGECVTLNDEFVAVNTVEGVLELNSEFIPIIHKE